MGQLIEKRWTRYGKDRVYVRTADGADVGFVDLRAGSVVAATPGFEAALQDCLRRWSTATPATAPPEPEVAEAHAEPPATAIAARDLAGNTPGAAVRAKRDELNAEAPIMNLVWRLLKVKSDERAWRVGAKGEERVGKDLSRLGPRWRRLHSVPVGRRGSDIDHVVIGPPGVVTLNTKRRPDATAWVCERIVIVNGHRTDYLRNSRHEAQRSERLLSSACGRAVAVRSAIVFVDLADFTVKQMPADIHVTTREGLTSWLRSSPELLDDAEVEMIFAKARLSTTWQ